MTRNKLKSVPIWLTRLALGAVFVMNVNCALAFIFQPESYIASFEVSGAVGRAIVQGFGILFLMWNATYPPVILQPDRHPTLFKVILIQQLIGVVGESWLYTQLPAEHNALRATGHRFIFFDSLGLLLLTASFISLHLRSHKQKQVAPA